MRVTLGHTVFEDVEYDAVTDILYLRNPGADRPDDWDQSQEGHALVYAGGDLVGVDILGARAIVADDGKIAVTTLDGVIMRSPDAHLAVATQTAA